MAHPTFFLPMSSCLCRKPLGWFEPTYNDKVALTHRSIQVPLFFHDSLHLLCHQGDSRILSPADFFRQEACPTSCVSLSLSTHRFSSISLAGRWQRLSWFWQLRTHCLKSEVQLPLWALSLPESVSFHHWTRGQDKEPLSNSEEISPHHLLVHLFYSFCRLRMNDGYRSQIMVCACGDRWRSPLACVHIGSGPSLYNLWSLISFVLNFPVEKNVTHNIPRVCVVCPTRYEI